MVRRIIKNNRDTTPTLWKKYPYRDIGTTGAKVYRNVDDPEDPRKGGLQCGSKAQIIRLF
jgi:hypothetical protein